MTTESRHTGAVTWWFLADISNQIKICVEYQLPQKTSTTAAVSRLTEDTNLLFLRRPQTKPIFNKYSV